MSSPYIRFMSGSVGSKRITPFKKILIANRGEIVKRICATANKMNIKTVGIFSTLDKTSDHMSYTNESYHIPGYSAKENYLNMDAIISAAKYSNCDAIHPGYGFLSQSPEFAEKCVANNIVWIGPSSYAISVMGIKSTSKDLMKKIGVPVIPGYHGSDQSNDTLVKEAIKIGFPVMIKPIRGGGGKGMHVVYKESDLVDILEMSRREALKSFGDSELLIEKFIVNPRHIEVQIIGDNYGNVFHLNERECSIQRRHQKIIEEAPAPGISDETRQKLGLNSVLAAKAVKYSGAGTVEYIMDVDQKFYFMEMNTRLQVEHPVTEFITKLDLVEMQINSAQGHTLDLDQSKIKIDGHAIEARIYTEDIENNFLPTSGRLTHFVVPEEFSNNHNAVRVDYCTNNGYINSSYDPMMAKVIAWSKNRDSAITLLSNQLTKFQTQGISTNTRFVSEMLKHNDFVNGKVTTSFVENNSSSFIRNSLEYDQNVMSIGAVIINTGLLNNISNPLRGFRLNAHKECMFPATFTFNFMNKEVRANVRRSMFGDEIGFYVKINEHADPFKYQLIGATDKSIKCLINDRLFIFQYNLISPFDFVLFNKDENYYISMGKAPYYSDLTKDSLSTSTNPISPMTGAITKVMVSVGDTVKDGQALMIIEAMKMEHIIKSNVNGKITKVFYQLNQTVERHSVLMNIEGST